MTEEDDKLKKLLEPDLDELPKKQCDSCDNKYPLHTDYFHKDAQRPDGFRNVCSRCREQQRQNAIITDKSKEIDRFEKKITDFIGDVSLEFQPGISRKENVGELYEATLNAFGGIKNIGSLFAIVFAKSNTSLQVRMLDQISRMSTKVTELGLSDQSYEDMSEEELIAEIERKSKAAKMPSVAAALMESMKNKNKVIAEQKYEIIEVDHEVHK